MHAGREFMERFWYHVKKLVNAHTDNQENPHRVTKEQIGLGNVEDKNSEMIRAEMTSSDVTDALGYTPSNVSHTHPVSQVTGLTRSRALVSDSSGHPAVSGVTATELGYLDGATSNIQNQINSLNSNFISESRVVKINGQPFYYFSKSGYELVSAINGDWDSNGQQVTGIAKQGSSYIVFLQEASNTNFRFNLLWKKSNS